MNDKPHPNPVASVIVVAWRLVDELHICLDSLQGSVGAPPFEVIVIVNGDDEDVAEVARQHPVVTRVIRRQANVGFGAAGNIAAAAARGTFLIFLNDDTQVDTTWLSAITRAGAEHPIVASLLLNFDGTVQEAGSRLLSYGGTVQLGRGLTIDEAAERGVLRPRPIDYGSGAALLFRRSLFLSLAGFDPIFEPAYFEDVDLQLRAQAGGHRVWFEPGARVLHHSGHSTQSDHWFRQFAANRSGQRFAERWRSVLSSASGVDDPPDALCEIPEDPNLSSNSVSAMVPSLADIDVDDSPLRALRIARDYQEWLTAQLSELRDYHGELTMEPGAPTRHELEQRIHVLTRRVVDLEARGPLGLLKARIGKWVLSLQRSA